MTDNRVSFTRPFKRDFKREKSGLHGKTLDKPIDECVVNLLAKQDLPARYRDHPLKGDRQDCRECLLKPDLLLVYRQHRDGNLELVRLGSHSELFG